MMKKELVFLAVMVALVVSLSTLSVADEQITFVEVDSLESVVFVEGKNVLYTNQFFPSFSVERLVRFYPGVESVSMDVYGQTYGYVNVFGGVGTPFLIQPGITYEIHMSKPVTINFLDTTLLYG